MSVKVKQHDSTDCGPACISSISSHFRKRYSLSMIRQLCYTDKKGTNLLGMITALETLGFSAKGVKADFNSLISIDKPAIAHMVLKTGLHHFVVICQVKDQRIKLMDPATGSFITQTREDFISSWSGALVVVTPSANYSEKIGLTSSITRFWKIARAYRFQTFQIIIGSVIYTVIGLSTSIYVQKIVDNVLVDQNAKLMNLMSVFMIFILGIQIILSIVKSF